MRYDAELPQEYKSWLQLYRDLKKENLLEEKEVQFAPMPRSYRDMTGTGKLWRFDVDYIKARCFDELKGTMFTMQEYEKIQYCMIDNRMIQRGDPVDIKIGNILNALYEMGEY